MRGIPCAIVFIVVMDAIAVEWPNGQSVELGHRLIASSIHAVCSYEWASPTRTKRAFFQVHLIGRYGGHCFAIGVSGVRDLPRQP
jgi:hypothetical protein